MPEVLDNGLPERGSRSRFDFTEYADGQAWKFVKGQDYASRTDTFRYNIRRWAKANGYDVICRSLPAVGRDGRPVPLTAAEPVALAVRFERRNGGAPA